MESNGIESEARAKAIEVRGRAARRGGSMTTQEKIILACEHPTSYDANRPAGFRYRSEVRIGGQDVLCCTECWNESVRVANAERNAQAAERRAATVAEIEAAGFRVGQKVSGVKAILGGLCGTIIYHGTVKVGKWGGAYVLASGRHFDLYRNTWRAE